jgi:hypothetical protein
MGNLLAVNSLIKTSTNQVLQETLFCTVQSKLKPYDAYLEHAGLKPKTFTMQKVINSEVLILTATTGGPQRGFLFLEGINSEQ